MEFETAASRVGDAGATLTGAAQRIDGVHVGPTVAGGASSDSLGELGRALAGLAAGALIARAAEARDLGSGLAELAATGQATAAEYRTAGGFRGVSGV